MKNPYISSSQRFFTLLSAATGVLGVLLSGWNVLQPPLPPLLILLKDLAIFGTLLILTLYFFLEYRKQLHRSEDLQKLNESQVLDFQRLVGKQIEAFHSLMSDTREALYRQQPGPSQAADRFSYRQEATLALLYDLLDSVIASLVRIMVNHLRVRFSDFDEDLSFSVKAVVTGSAARRLVDLDPAQEATTQDNELYVITLDRDHRTKKELKVREVRKRLYKTNDNTAFTKIFHGQGACFYSNDLGELARLGHYENQNENWEQFYNATLVVPIWPQGQETESPRIFGFLAIDCLNEKKRELFDANEGRGIAAFGADLLALIFLNLELFDAVKSVGTRDRQRAGS